MNKHELLGEAESFVKMLEQVSKLAPLNKPVLIIGERGTGKEQIAQRLHYLSSRWDNPFIALNCSALNENLLDSELFGHEAGSFTGAQRRHPGRFERANTGTLFLDELATAAMPVQEKLLRVIEYGQFERVGGSDPVTVDVRLICATNANLPLLAQQGKFRFDLLDRLAFDVVQLPPLRHRQQDIMLLAEHFAIQMSQELALPFFPGFTERAQRLLLGYSWPGNIRELRNVVERSVYHHNSTRYPLDNIILNPFNTIYGANIEEPQPQKHSPVLPLNLTEWLAKQKDQAINAALQQAKFNHRQAAELLGLTYHQLRGILRKQQANKQDR